jgi:hypothetical protein
MCVMDVDLAYSLLYIVSARAVICWFDRSAVLTGVGAALSQLSTELDVGVCLFCCELLECNFGEGCKRPSCGCKPFQ